MKQRCRITPDEAVMRLQALCAASEQCTAEIQRRLQRWEINQHECDRIIRELIEERFIDDLRFARAYVRDKYRFAHWGRSRIVMQLRARSISRDNINDALAEIDEDEYESILLRLLRTKVRSARLSDSYADRSKLWRFAAMRGFESSLISRLISKGLPWTEEDGLVD